MSDMFTDSLAKPKPGAVPLCDFGHNFRGKLIDICSEIERWAIDLLTSKRAQAKIANEPMHLFGHKLKAVRKLAELDKGKPGPDRVLKSPTRVIELLDELQPFSDLKSALGHATQQVAITEDGSPLYLYSIAGKTSYNRLILTQKDFDDILKACRSLLKRFGDQRMQPEAPKPSEPPQPKPGEAAGP
jgi:hypothetical protein